MIKMDNWEEKMDQVDLKEMLGEIDRALLANLAAELGFPSFQRLKQSSEIIIHDFHVTFLSDGRWVWWHPQRYASEDPIFFAGREQIVQYIGKFLKLDDDQTYQLRKGLASIPQTSKCLYCEHEFLPATVERTDEDDEWELDLENYCSRECALDAIQNENDNADDEGQEDV
jgi:hypothetical protein